MGRIVIVNFETTYFYRTLKNSAVYTILFYLIPLFIVVLIVAIFLTGFGRFSEILRNGKKILASRYFTKKSLKEEYEFDSRTVIGELIRLIILINYNCLSNYQISFKFSPITMNSCSDMKLERKPLRNYLRSIGNF